jgi:hypothetical protein
LVSDLAGGVVALSTDDAGFHLHRFEAEWRPDREPVAPFALGPTTGRTNMRIAADGRGGAFLVWEERSKIQAFVKGMGSFKADVRVQHVDLRTRVASPVVPLPTETPAFGFAVRPVAPNPAVSSCRITFDLPRQERVAIDVFDVAGRRVARLADGRLYEAGSQSLEWDLRDRRGGLIPPGLYFVRVTAGRNQAVVRVTVIR